MAPLPIAPGPPPGLAAQGNCMWQSIAAGGEAGDADIDSALEAKAAQLTKEGFLTYRG